jgi:hypothetical protein
MKVKAADEAINSADRPIAAPETWTRQPLQMPSAAAPPAAPSELDAAADDVGGIRPRRDIEQQPGKDEQPEFMNAQHFFNHPLHELQDWRAASRQRNNPAVSV